MFKLIVIACVFAGSSDTDLICQTYRVEKVESCIGFIDKLREANPEVLIKELECVRWE